MDYEEFRNKVEKELKGLDKKQIVYFAWRCALRVLPFLGAGGDFNFWEQEKRQNHLYSIFYALDVVAISLNKDYYCNYKNIASSVSRAVRNDFASNASKAAIDTNTNVKSDIVNAVIDAVSFAVYTVNAESDDKKRYAIRAAARSLAACKDTADITETLFSDIHNIANDIKIESNSSIICKNTWDNFVFALKREDCEYWGTIYSSFFEEKLILRDEDYKAIEKRVNVPIEIREKGALEVSKYLSELDKGARNFNESRIIILGDKGAGKTCIARRLVNPDAPMTTDAESTAGVDKVQWLAAEGENNIHIWDFGGHVVTHAVHQFFLSERCLYIIVYDGRTEERNRLNYWLDHMKNYGGDSQAMILVNLRDDHKPEIPINNLRDNYRIEGCYEFSIRDDKEKLLNFRKKVIEYITTHPSWDKQEIPVSYYKVKTELEKVFDKDDKKNGEEFISLDKFKEISGQKDFERYREYKIFCVNGKHLDERLQPFIKKNRELRKNEGPITNRHTPFFT